MKIQDLLDFLITAGREILLKDLPPASCVSSTRFAIEYLKLNGIEAYPQPVHCLIARGNEIVLLGRNPNIEINNWNGHLVAIVGGYVLDMTLDQAGLIPSYFPISGFPASYVQNGVNVIYFEDAKAGDFTKFDSWNEKWKNSIENIS